MTYDSGLREFASDSEYCARKKCRNEAVHTERDDRKKEEDRIAA
jgi:hypothetical protein